MDIAVLACFFQFGQLDREHVLSSMRLFAEQVLPAVAGLSEARLAQAL